MKVFVSSTYEDLKEYRATVKDAILKMGMHPIMMEDLTASSNPPKRECLKRVEEADVLIGIYAHRYGTIPKGDAISITEQEYRHAKARGKQILCFLIEPNYAWPSEHREDSEELQTFLREVKDTTAGHFVAWFETSADVAIAVSQALAKIQQEQMGPWQKKAQHIPASSKLAIINDLIELNYRERIEDAPFKISTSLISSDFDSVGSSVPPKLIEHTGELLEGSISLKQFAFVANKLMREAGIRVPWHQRLRRVIRENYKLAASFLVAGIAIGVLSYIFNWFDVRSAYLAPSDAYRTDVVNWLVKKARTNTTFGDTSIDSAKVAMAAIGFAHELDPDNAEVRDYLDKLLDNTRMFTKSPNAKLATLRNNRLLLEGYYAVVRYEKFRDEADALLEREGHIVYSASAQEALDYLQKQAKDASTTYGKILTGYRQMLAEFPNYTKADSVAKNIIPALVQDSTRFAQHRSTANSDTLTIVERLKMWEKYKPSSRISWENACADSVKLSLKNIITKSAHITDESKFATCESVVDRDPRNRKTRFAPGQVWAWARVSAPGTEMVTFRWYLNGQPFGDDASYRVDRNLDPGYRVFAARSYDADQQGINEVRLYNSQNYLIGRKVFRVGQRVIATK